MAVERVREEVGGRSGQRRDRICHWTWILLSSTIFLPAVWLARKCENILVSDSQKPTVYQPIGKEMATVEDDDRFWIGFSVCCKLYPGPRVLMDLNGAHLMLR